MRESGGGRRNVEEDGVAVAVADADASARPVGVVCVKSLVTREVGERSRRARD